jgi:hypothetical protein
MNYKELNGVSIREGFTKFNGENPHIYEEFEKQALAAIHKGRKKISAKLIINWIRWNEYLRTSDQNFKINDAYQSYYARYFIERHPQYEGLFEFRKLRNEEEGAYMEINSNGMLTFLIKNSTFVSNDEIK